MTPGQLSDTIVAVLRAAVEAGELAVTVPDAVTIERPKNRDHGDYATNAALQLAKPAGRPPRAVAELIAARLREVDGIRAVDVAGPGFLNLRLAEGALGQVARSIVRSGPAYGSNDSAAGDNVNLEFVSANPTGPIHIGGVRWAAVGDALGRLLEASGAKVTREYYINDAGVQIDRFAASLVARLHGRPTPLDGYGGEYVAEIAQRVQALHPDLREDDELAVFRAEGVRLMLEEIRQSLADFRVEFDVFFSETALHEAGELDEAVVRLREQGHVYEQDGAVWLRTTDFGDDKDRVLVKSDGEPTYFCADAAYYLDKRKRGFDRCVYMLGADHHGYVGRLRALAACFGDDPDLHIEVLIGQLVNLLRDGEPVRMSKRAGDVVTIEDFVEAVGVDAGRYALARASTDSMIDIDIDLWTRRSSDNPVYYVQYVAARTAGVHRNAVELGLDYALETVDVALLSHERETDLIRALGEFPRIVASAAELRAPHRVARYLEETVAPAFHKFYDECRVLPRGDEEITDLHRARLLLVDATRVVVANALGLLGVSAPERM